MSRTAIKLCLYFASYMQHRVLHSECRLKVPQVEAVKDVVRHYAEQPKVEHSGRIVFIDMIGEVVINAFVEALILNVPAGVSDIDNGPCVSALW